MSFFIFGPGSVRALLLRPSAINFLHSVDAPRGASKKDATAELDKHILGMVQTDTPSRSHLQAMNYRSHLSSNASNFRRMSSKADYGNYDVIPPTGITFKDVKEGELGTCYFLAALIALARTHPYIIEEMFVHRELWSHSPQIFTTQWYLNGVRQEVAVNSEIPTDPDTMKPFFTKPNEGASFWPVILEKTWGKIFGSYRNVAGGHMAEAFKAITHAPVYKIDHDSCDYDYLKSMLQTAFDSHFAVGAASRENTVGIPSGHAYIVFGICNVPGFGQSVTMYNPWARDVYAGAIPNPDKTDGLFNMTWAEYIDSFDHTTIAFIVSGYQTTTTLLDSPDPEETIMNAAMVVRTTSAMPFTINLEWPSERFLPGCKKLSPIYTLSVAPLEDPTANQYAYRTSPTMNNAHVTMNFESKGGAREWVVFLYAEFPNARWLEYVTLSVYAAEEVHFRIGSYENASQMSNYTTMAHSLFLQQEGLCDKIDIAGRGFFERRDDLLVNGIPSYHALDVSHAGTHRLMFWHSIRVVANQNGSDYIVNGKDTWEMTDTLEHAALGEYWGGFDKDKDVKCASGQYTWSESADFRELPDANTQAVELEDSQDNNSNSSSSSSEDIQNNHSNAAEALADGAHDALLQVRHGTRDASEWPGRLPFPRVRHEKTKMTPWSVSLLASHAGKLQTEDAHYTYRRKSLHRAAQRRSLSNVIHESRATQLIQQQTKGPSVDSQQRENDYHCATLVRRLQRINNIDQMKISGRDDYFPASQVSIGAANDTCEDSAGQVVKYCSAYNHWDTFGNIVKQVWARQLVQNMTIEAQERCISRTPPQPGDEVCAIQNICDDAMVLICSIFDATTGKDAYHILGPMPPRFEGTSPLEYCQCGLRVQGDMLHFKAF